MTRATVSVFEESRIGDAELWAREDAFVEVFRDNRKYTEAIVSDAGVARMRDLPIGNYTLGFRTPHGLYEVVDSDELIIEKARTEPFTARLVVRRAETYAISGTIEVPEDVQGASTGTAAVKLVSTEGKRIGGSSLKDGNQFSISGIPNGRYELVARARGCSETRKAVVVSGSDVKDCKLKLSALPLVTFEPKPWVEYGGGRRVVIHVTDGARSWRLRLDKTGSRIRLPSGEYWWNANAVIPQNGQNQPDKDMQARVFLLAGTLSVDESGEQIVVSLPRIYRVSGVVTGLEGRKSIEIAPANKDRAAVVAIRRMAGTDFGMAAWAAPIQPDGSFRMEISKGEYVLAIPSGSGIAVTSEMSIGGDVKNLNMDLAESSRIVPWPDRMGRVRLED